MLRRMLIHGEAHSHHFYLMPAGVSFLERRKLKLSLVAILILLNNDNQNPKLIREPHKLTLRIKLNQDAAINAHISNASKSREDIQWKLPFIIKPNRIESAMPL